MIRRELLYHAQVFGKVFLEFEESLEIVKQATSVSAVIILYFVFFTRSIIRPTEMINGIKKPCKVLSLQGLSFGAGRGI